MAEFEPRIFSGAQPSGNLHLGNYLGAVRRWVELQETYQSCLFCVVDLHAITVWQDPAELERQTREVAAAYIAAGIDTKKHILFNQSRVKEHAELAWIFNCVARIGWMNRMTQFKDKAGKDRENASAGLYVYPNLMAADILAYRATHVPVGDDQKQHVELTRDIAAKFNNDYSARIAGKGFGIETRVGAESVNAFFPLPEPLIGGPATRVMSLKDGTKKMSKSDPSDLSRINLTDDSETIARKIRKAKTDSDNLPSEVAGLAGRAEADNLVGIYSALSARTKPDVLSEFGGRAFSDFKPALADLAVETVGPIAGEMRRILADPAEIDRTLREGGERARAIAARTLSEVKEIVGLLDG